MKFTPSWWRFLSAWGKFKLEEHPEVLQVLPRCTPEQPSRADSVNSDTKRLSDRFPEDVPAQQEIESASSITEVATSISSTQTVSSGPTVVAKDTPLTLERLRENVDSATGSGSVKDRKADMVKLAIDDIGVGLYQYKLFVACASGWFADGVWILGIALLVDVMAPEFGISKDQSGYGILALFGGLFLGALGWGILSDLLGRRMAFNVTLPIAAVAALLLSQAVHWWQVILCLVLLGSGVGGNIPVDGNLFMEFLPDKDSSHMILMSAIWACGSILTSGIVLSIVPNNVCDASELPACVSVAEGITCCTRDDNSGWRMAIFAMFGVLSFICVSRSFGFHLQESPTFLMSKGRQREAVLVIQALAWYNGTTTWLSEELLEDIAGRDEDVVHERLTFGKKVRKSASHFLENQLRPLFSGTRMSMITILVWFCWLVYGIAIPLFGAFLPGLLSKVGGKKVPLKSVYTTAILSSLAGMVGPVISMLVVKTPLGDAWSATIGTVLTAGAMVLFPSAKTSNHQTLVTCAVYFFMYGAWSILMMLTSKVFPTKCRGTGSGSASSLSRVGGIIAPLIGINIGAEHASQLVYTAGGLIGVAGIALVALAFVLRRARSQNATKA